MTHGEQDAARIAVTGDGLIGSARLVCLVAAERADEFLPPLREHFAGEPRVAVLVERRARTGGRHPLDPPGQIRRAPVAERNASRMLPPELRHQAPHLRLVQPMEPLRRTHEDTDTADLLAKTLALEPEAISELWWRVSPRVLARVELRLGPLAVKSASRDLVGRILDELPGYQAEQESLSAWLDSVADRYAEEHPCRAFVRP